MTTRRRRERALEILTATAVVLAFLHGTPAAAQGSPEPPLHVAIGYSYLDDLGLGGAPSVTYPTGWTASVGRQVGHSPIALVGEVGGNYHTNLVVEREALYGFLGGLRGNLWRLGRLHLFAEGLVGAERFSEPGFSEWGLALQPGVGVDLALTSRMGVRVEGDYRAVREEGVTFREGRALVGLVLGLGR
jgi:hypothetical protein